MKHFVIEMENGATILVAALRDIAPKSVELCEKGFL